MSTTSSVSSWVGPGLVALSVYGVVLSYTTRTPQPDQTVDPEGWARFVADGSYLAEHVTSNVLGVVLVIYGTFALAAVLIRGPARRLALWGMVLAVTGHILSMVPGTISTFATPAIGAAYLDGHHDVMMVEFPPMLTAILALAMLLTVAGNIILGVAIVRSRSLPRGAGWVWVTATLVFYVLGAALGMATTGASLLTQPIGAALMAVSSAWIAWTVVRHPSPAQDASAAPNSAPRTAPALH